MSREKLFEQRTRQAPSARRRETFIAPKPLPVCCMCGFIREEAGSSPDRERWVTQRTYRKLHGANPTYFSLTHTYCPKCFAKFQKTVRQYLRKIETSP